MDEIRKCMLVPNRKINVGKNPNKVMIELSIFMDIFSLCEETKTFPRQGGLLDQDSLYIHLMRQAMTQRSVRKQLDQANPPKPGS